YANLQFAFGLVEMALYRVGESDLLMQPRVLARSAILNRTVIQVEGGGATVDTIEEVESADLDPVYRFYRDFWGEFLEELELDDVGQPLANVTKSPNIFFPLPPSGMEIWVSAFLSPSKGEVGAYLGLSRAYMGKGFIKNLEEDDVHLGEELGPSFTWDPKSNHPARAVMDVENPHADADRERIKAFLAESINTLVNVFRPRLERIARDS
ncbi:MAG: hypothetical protein ACLFRB_10180, partial [Thiohalorhabdus sp.]